MSRTYLALIPLYQGHFEEAISILNDGIIADNLGGVRTDSASIIKNIIKANIYLELEDYKSVEFELNKTIEMQESLSDDVINRIGPYQEFLFAKIGDYETAGKIVDDLKPKDDTASWNSYWKAMAYLEFSKGHFEKTIEYLTKPDLVRNKDFKSNYILGRAYLESENYNEAAGIFERILKDYYNQSRSIQTISAVYSHYYLGQAYDNMDQFEKSRQQYELFSNIWKNAEPMPTAVRYALDRLEYLRQISNSPNG